MRPDYNPNRPNGAFVWLVVALLTGLAVFCAIGALSYMGVTFR